MMFAENRVSGVGTTNAVVIGCDYNGCVFECRVLPLGGTAVYCPLGCFLLVNSVANGEAVTSLLAATCENLAAIGSAHAVTETMLVSFLAV